MHALIVVTHLLGAGHLSRALTLGRGFVAEGWRATVVSGGMPAPQFDPGPVRLVQIPPLRSDGVNFKRLLTEEGIEADDAYRRARIDALIDALHEAAPQAVITELYPFGRRTLRREFQALLEAAHALEPRPKLYSSIRDILDEPKKLERVEETADVLLRYYDGAFVHGDPDLVRLDASWPVPPRIRDHLVYTGYAAPEPPQASAEGDGAGEVLVSSGGGPIGRPLFIAAVHTARLPENTLRWRILVGGADAAAIMAELKALAGDDPRVIIEAARRDYRAMLTRAAVSVSRAGYNTALDLIATGAPAVLVPFENGETEQHARATLLARNESFTTLREAEMTPPDLLKAALCMAARGRSGRMAIRADGARQTARLLMP